jgi:hypothetical protein
MKKGENYTQIMKWRSQSDLSHFSTYFIWQFLPIFLFSLRVLFHRSLSLCLCMHLLCVSLFLPFHLCHLFSHSVYLPVSNFESSPYCQSFPHFNILSLLFHLLSYHPNHCFYVLTLHDMNEIVGANGNKYADGNWHWLKSTLEFPVILFHWFSNCDAVVSHGVCVFFTWKSL